MDSSVLPKLKKKNQIASKATEFSGRKNAFLFEIWSYISQTSKNTSTFFHAAFFFFCLVEGELKSLNLCCPDLMFHWNYIAWEIKLHTGPTSAMCWVLTHQTAAWSIITWKKMLVWFKNEARVFMLKAASQGAAYPRIGFTPRWRCRRLPKPSSLDFYVRLLLLHLQVSVV